MDKDLLESIAEDAWRRSAACAKGRVSFPRADLAALHPAIATRLFRRAIARLGGSADLEAIHILALRDCLDKRSNRLSLPGGLRVVLDSHSLSFAKGSRKPAVFIPETRLAVPGFTQVGNWIVEAEIVPPPADLEGAGPLEAYFDAEALGRRLAVRSRRPGDRLRPLGLGGGKKVQDILVDAKVPEEDRNSVPLVCENDAVVWVVGHRIDEGHALHPDSVTAVRLRFTPRGSSSVELA
jgi:tRNA(Ile)-lysidine synthase